MKMIYQNLVGVEEQEQIKEFMLYVILLLLNFA